MKALYHCSEIRSIERRAMQEFLLREETLVENAGRSCWELLAMRIECSDAIVVLVGGGNNAADAAVLARHAQCSGHTRLDILLCSTHIHELCTLALDRCRKLNIAIHAIDSKKSDEILHSAQWIVDGLCGMGLSGAMKTPYEAIVARLSGLKAQVFSIDVPSGAHEGFRQGDAIITAHYTAMTGARKALCYSPLVRPHCGVLLFASAAFPLQSYPVSTVQLLEKDDSKRYISLPPSDSHKKQRGELAVCAGSEYSPGAALLSAAAGLHSLAGIVKIYTDATFSFESFPSLMKGKDEGYLHADAVVLGPGWGLQEAQRSVLSRLLKSKLPLVLDADALTLLAQNPDMATARGNMVFTPHPGEAARLCRMHTTEVLESASEVSLQLAKKYQAIVLLKSHVPILAFPDGRIFVIDGMNAALSTAGSGDVLAGIVGGLIASGHDLASATLAAMIVHQGAGELMRSIRGFGTSRDIISFLPQLISLDSEISP